ncbi:PilW family protein [Litorilituus lipolyticus]|uniref:Prepilin-type cleavage/methylation domain-containing protein n=1 Tax=Litorilituus lipolyticus TaxID=2491017 RepID=A0A502LA23_9GAMM|nr:PilW family protein [Litorilituus lipolyticus]TPH19235.1 prepilin-type cleavage/methylation domain-containing protein [Litorilituus lipolyticus]
MKIYKQQKQKGFTIVEIFIALTIGLVLFAGVLSIFVGLSTTTKETSSYGELQENGRFAISVLTADLLRQNFWGDFGGTFGRSNLIAVPAPPANDCIGEGINNSTFPAAVGHFRTLWGQSVIQADPMGCFTDAKINANANLRSELIQIKRSIGEDLLVAPAGNYYLTTTNTTGSIYAGGAGIPALENSRTWRYQHHVYYVREEAVGNEVVPVLMQGRLTNQAMNFAPIIDGIEIIRFSYGIDSTGNGEVNTFVSTDNMTNALWNNANGNRILAVKIFVLARSIARDIKYTNTNTYQLADTFVAVNDNYRRLLFTSTVVLPNSY